MTRAPRRVTSSERKEERETMDEEKKKPDR
jgi:hypothetical protein